MGGAAGGPGPSHRGCRPSLGARQCHKPCRVPSPPMGPWLSWEPGGSWRRRTWPVCRLGCPLHLALSLPALLGSRPLGQVEGGAGAGHSLCLPSLQETSQSGFSRGGPWPFRSWCFPASCRSCSGPQLLLVFFTVTGMELTKGPWRVGRRHCPHPGGDRGPPPACSGTGEGSAIPFPVTSGQWAAGPRLSGRLSHRWALAGSRGRRLKS